MKKQVFILIVSLLIVAGKAEGACSATISGGVTSICYNTSPGLFTAAGSGGTSYTYEWYLNGTSTGIVTQTYNPGNLTLASNTIRCDVSCDAGVAVSSNVITITVNSLPTATAVNNGPVCIGNTLSLTGGTNGLTSYAWSGPDSFTSTAQSPTVSTNATAAMAGSYTITVVDGNGCTKTASTTVIVNALPAPTPSAANNGPVCVGTALSLTGGADGMTTYTWSGPNSFSSTVQSPTVSTSATTAMAGTYILTVLASTGCTNTVITTVTVNSLPTANALNNGPVCVGTTLSLTGGADGLTSYSWSGPDSFSSAVQSPTVSTNATAAMAGSYTLTVVDGNVCTNTATTTVTVNPIPVPGITGSNRVCAGSTGNVYTTESGKTSYDWTVSTGGLITGGGDGNNTVTVTWNTSGSQTVSVTYSSLSCPAASPTVFNVTVEPNNASNVVYTGSFTEGGKLTVNYDFSSLSCFPDDRTLTKYTWNKDNNTSHGIYTANIAQKLGDSTYVLPAGIATYYIMVKVEIWNGFSYQTAVESIWSAGTVGANSVPVASSINILGTALVNETLSGTYTYTDAESDAAATPDYQWVRANSNDGSGSSTNIGTTSTYKLVAADAGKFIGLKVTPKAAHGGTPGSQAIMASPWFGPIVANAPVATNVKILGDTHSGMTVYGSYSYYDAENDAESGSTYEWYYADDAAGTINKNTIGVNSISYKIPDTYINKYIGFSVIPGAASPPSPGTKVTTTIFVGPVANDPPVASGLAINGPVKYNVDDILTADYNYTDYEGDLQGTSVYEWWRSSDNTLTITDEQIVVPPSIGYKLTLADTGKYIFFKVTPKALTGTLTGIQKETSPVAKRVNTPPYAEKQAITYLTTDTVGQLLTGHYIYHDHDGDAEGISTFRWLRDGTPIPGAIQSTYTVDLDDEGKLISFEVTPVSSTGYPNTGTAVVSDPLGPIPVSVLKPQASEVCIQGIRAENEWLTGKYKYTFARKSEGVSTYRWLIGADSLTATPISGAESITYHLTGPDISSGKNIYFEVTPVSDGPAKVGKPVISTRIARITLDQDQYDNLVDTVKLTVIPKGGAFSGPGVTNGIFSPKAVGTTGSPYSVQYLYNIVNTTTTCSQRDSKSIKVVASLTKFHAADVKSVICKSDAPFWVTVDAIPADAIPYIDQGYYVPGGYGWDYGFFINDAYYYGVGNNSTNKGILSEIIPNEKYVEGTTAKWKVQIDPSQLNVGIGANILYLYYQDKFGYYNLIQIPLNVEEVGVINEISNLNPAYCKEDPIQDITVYGLYPTGGSATWTGDVITDLTKHNLTAKLDPSLGTPGTSYPITYQYKTTNSCYSNILNYNVTINPVPNADFSVAPYSNIEGGAINLVPAVPAPTGTGATATFIGAGVSGNIFYPNISGVGSFNIEYKVKTAENCTHSTTNTAEVDKPTGDFNNLPSKMCYSDTTYNIYMSNLPSDLAGYTVLNFTNKKKSLVWTSGLTGQYNVADAGAGYDTLWFSYKRKGVDFTLSKGVFIDSIGNITITGLKAEYCDYEGIATVRALVGNSTGNGTFSFTGQSAAFTNYVGYATLDPAKVTSGTQYYVNYNFTSNIGSPGCRKTETLPVLINQSPSVSIFNTRTTVNIKEAPIVLSGSPADGIFSGKGVYKSGTSYVFDPLVAGLGDIEFTLAYTDIKGCSASKKDTLTVAAASGSILGINANNQYCYDGPKDQLTYSSTKPWTSGSFSGAGITNTGSASADFDPAAAGKGDHDIVFTYSDLSGTVFNISATVNVDSLGKVAIQNLLAGDKYCNTDAPFELFTTPKGGTFTGPVISGSLIPSKALGDTAVTYMYLNVRTGCSITGRVPFRINPSPAVSFIPSDGCIENSTDSIRFINSTVSADRIKEWLWSFSDASGTGLSPKGTPAYIFKTGGRHLVTLTATTINDCSVKVDSTFDLGVKPIADFYWKNECYHPGESLQLFDTTFSTSSVASRTWNFFDGGPLLSGTTVTYPKKGEGYQKVQYIVKTIYTNCSDTVTKNIFIRPSVTLATDSYFQDFETGNGGWVKFEDTGNSWSFGKPGRTVINSAASGNNAWFTNYPMANQKIESSSIVSPCFDFPSSVRPMISLKLWRQFDLTRDGAALQYKVKDEKNWHYVGTLEDGINWYNSAVIKGKPGGDPLGWTIKDNSWIESRHTLDELINKKDVKLRIVYGSDGTSTDNDGIAFDDIWIGDRSRKVLLEHFENSSSTPSKDATAMVNNIVSAKSKDVINIQYHTNFPGTDPYYNENPADASARILFYGLIRAPYSFLDGGNDKLNYAKNYDYNLANIDSNDVTRRSLINPRFDISLTSTVSGGILTVSGKLTALETLSSDNLTLFITVTEKKNKNHTGANGETVFYNVFRKSIPDAGGIGLKKTWTKGETYTLTEKTWVIEKIQNASDIDVIAFIQDNVKREIYQAASITEPNIAVGIESLFGGKGTDFALYPNPAVNKLTIGFKEPLTTDADIKIYDLQGIVIKTYKAGSGSSEFTIDNVGLKSGIYMLRVSAGSKNLGFRKLIVSTD